MPSTYELSDEHTKIVEHAMKEQIEDTKKRTEEIKKDNVKALLDCIKQMDPGSEMHQDADATKGDDDKISGDDDEKEKEKDEKKKAAKSAWQQFREAAEKVREWAGQFLERLKNAPIELETKKQIRGVCQEYFQLLEETQNVLQQQRLHSESLRTTLLDLRKLMNFTREKIAGPEKSLVGKENQKREQIVAGFERKFQKLGTDLEGSSKQRAEISVLQGKWSTMSKHIDAVVDQVAADLETFKKQMAVLLGVAGVVIGVLGAVACVVTGGLAGPAVVAALGTVYAVGAGLLAGALVFGAVAFGIAMLAVPKLVETLNLVNNQHISAIKDGLKNVSSQAKLMEAMLGALFRDWEDLIRGADPIADQAADLEIYGKVGDEIVTTVDKCAANLEKLIRDIEDTEAAVRLEYQNFVTNIQKPLNDMILN